jgi:hypothetical protein
MWTQRALSKNTIPVYNSEAMGFVKNLIPRGGCMHEEEVKKDLHLTCKNNNKKQPDSDPDLDANRKCLLHKEYHKFA